MDDKKIKRRTGKRKNTFWIIIMLSGWLPCSAFGQISPGDLAAVHAHIEGISNCTKCHTLGSKVTNEKCLECHTEVKERITRQQGFHVSAKTKGKPCISCHSDHHGRNFDIIHFQKDAFDHTLAGYPLVGAHARQTCEDCHKPDHIADNKIRTKKFTFLGLTTDCLGCHVDYHQQTLARACLSCHSMEAFKPAENFNHEKTNFPLTGRHQTVECSDCHKTTIRNGKDFQEFSGIDHQNCTSCHTDIHQNKFGQRCTDCHTTVSFRTITGMSGFDHSSTGFPLENKHAGLVCSSCHKGSLTDPLKHEKCIDCHRDYHEGDFIRQGSVRSCADCHTTKGFQESSYTLQDHNQGAFILRGSHQATPCFTCHMKNEHWRFRDIGETCSDCHNDIHFPHIREVFYPGLTCQSCHDETSWSYIRFDHTLTDFPLTGVHARQSCRSCHFKTNGAGETYQLFSELDPSCSTCHSDHHYGQFNANGSTDCLRCHDTERWTLARFDHNTKTLFKLEGRHAQIACSACHKTVLKDGESYILYKIGDTRCEHCH